MAFSKTPKLKHVFIVSYPVQGQINPLLRLAKRLASTGGFLVTFSTIALAGEKIIKANSIIVDHLYPVGIGFLRFDFFDVDCPGIDPCLQVPEFFPKFELDGRNWVKAMIRRSEEEGRGVDCLISGTMVSWLGGVAEEVGIPMAIMWPQSCASFLSFYYHYNKLVPFPTEEEPNCDVEIPTLPLLKWDEVHSFLHPAFPMQYIAKMWINEFQHLDKSFCVIMDTFDELEDEIIDFATRLCPTVKAMGPLFRDPNSATLVRADTLKADSRCLDWLDTKPPRSVVFVCFGTIEHLKQEQVDEIAHGILNTRAPFLWVMRPPKKGSFLGGHALLHEVGPENRMIVEYSPQEQVLAHPSVACFVTHCGWNSTMEAMTSGVPMVAFPQWGDQLTTAKFLVDMFRVAVRMSRGEQEKMVVPREEVEMCIRQATVGPKAEEMRTKALIWKDKAEKVRQKGGSSNKNLHDFIEEIRKRSD